MREAPRRAGRFLPHPVKGTSTIVTLPVAGSAGSETEDPTTFGASGSAAIITGTRAVPRYEPRGCNSPRSYWRFQRNTWLAFTPFARAMPATLAPGSSVSFTILSFSSTRRNTLRLRPETPAPPMPSIVGCRSPAVQMGRPDAYLSPPEQPKLAQLGFSFGLTDPRSNPRMAGLQRSWR